MDSAQVSVVHDQVAFIERIADEQNDGTKNIEIGRVNMEQHLTNVEVELINASNKTTWDSEDTRYNTVASVEYISDEQF